MLRRYEVATDVQAEVKAWHDRAADALTFALPANEARDELLALVESLGNRSG
jgi:hypothetical protein